MYRCKNDIFSTSFRNDSFHNFLFYERVIEIHSVLSLLVVLDHSLCIMFLRSVLYSWCCKRSSCLSAGFYHGTFRIYIHLFLVIFLLLCGGSINNDTLCQPFSYIHEGKKKQSSAMVALCTTM